MPRELAREILSRNMQQLCAERGINPIDLAQDLGWPTTKLEMALSGSADITLDDLGQLVNIMNVPAHLLLASAVGPGAVLNTAAG